ncbi:hypothetical protein [Nannocystis sp.]|uniref:hypothetical protein n=1 Tax=Nannocystis sp. TaxID=1962667 RepID=UPI0025EFA315|nr:hypothetical protein [Nannocystis sp.]MBK7827667.1 hypothetical protein [Nannocystis sp.]
MSREVRQTKPGGQVKASSLPVHNATQVPIFMLSTFQHHAPATQSSMPLVGPPTGVHASPGTLSPVTSTHFVASQVPTPHQAHFWPAGQSCA